jgi:hypothetical protein
MMSCDCNRRVILPQFWGRHQSFFRQMLIAFKVPTLIKEIEAALSAGKVYLACSEMRGNMVALIEISSAL